MRAPWHKVGAGYFKNHKTVRLSHRAICLDLAAILECNDSLTDGVVSQATLAHVLIDSRAKRSDVRELVAVGRWEVTNSGWQIHDFDEFNPKATAVMEAHRVRAEKEKENRRKRRESTEEGAA